MFVHVQLTGKDTLYTILLFTQIYQIQQKNHKIALFFSALPPPSCMYVCTYVNPKYCLLSLNILND